MRLSVIGAGSFGTAMSIVAARCGHQVKMWSHDPAIPDGIAKTGRNPSYLVDFPLGDKVAATGSLAEAAAFSDVLVMVVPSHHYRGVLELLKPHIKQGIKVISATKGIESDTLDRMSEITSRVLGRSLRSFAVLSGPTFALETARGDPTAAVVASASSEFAEEAQKLLSCGSFRLYNTTDVVGVELAGSLKNVIAIAAGVLDGLGLGFNTNAALVTRGLHEMTKLGLALGGRLETFAGLAGMGDLVLTCTGALSRNRSVGVALGRGKALADILDESRWVAEGVKTSKAAKALAERHRIDMPITAEVYRVLYENESPKVAIQRLMSRALKAEATR